MSLNLGKTETDVQRDNSLHEPAMVMRELYGATIISLYLLGMVGVFAFIAARTNLETAIEGLLIFLLSCSCGIVLLWWQDEKLWSETLAGQSQPESLRVVSGGENHEALGATLP
jgi:protein-S-isoprenylcysteine O-methyltransferase Ste14